MADYCQVMNFFFCPEGSKRRRVPSDLCGPQVYRFLAFDTKGKARWSHIGETGQFRRRYLEYGREKGTTERDLCSHLGACASLKFTVELQFFDFEQIDLAGLLIVPQHLGDQHVRRLLESWATLRDHRAGIRILNSRNDLKAPDHPSGFVGEKKKSRASKYREIDRLSETPLGLRSLGG